ncbi:MAG: tRNA (adenosine(37)-N6)-dimethylallyltransferase MiaA [Bacteroidota bacterium]
MPQPTLIVIVGPTAIGKTELCIELAKSLNTEIISADSRQIYKELNIGTAKPAKEALEEIRHHFIGTKSIHDYYTAGMFELDVLEKLRDLFSKHNQIIMTGGSGLYINAVCAGIDALPRVDPEIRNKLIDQYEKEGIQSLRQDLKKLDPDYYEKADLKNPKRLLKALEITVMTGKSYSSFLTRSKKTRPFNILKVGLYKEREELYENINKRVDKMIDEGLLEEAKELYKHKRVNALNTVGYKELFEYLDGNITYKRAIELIKRNTRRYAKRQLTWFSKDEEIKWFQPDEKVKIREYIHQNIKE